MNQPVVYHMTRPGRWGAWIGGLTAVIGIGLMDTINHAGTGYERTLLFLALTVLIVASVGLLIRMARKRYVLRIEQGAIVVPGYRAYRREEITEIRLLEKKGVISIKSKRYWGWGNLTVSRHQSQAAMNVIGMWARRNGIRLTAGDGN
ncbi:hypothetical protein WMW72_31025 [Paenibacillus filicis]|uniref:DUF304 domain-containing protein n=1 Tax=Paenibacillus filicis TaxID=669464 RepID=A0ABU9DW53_9BACL